MSDATAPTPRPTHRGSGGPWLSLIVLVALAGAGWYGWRQWQARDAHERAAVADADHRIDALNGRINAMRDDMQAQAQRLQQADATNRVMREELLGIGQRAALLEDSVSQLSDPTRTGIEAVRLEEVELLLMLGEQRLRVAADLDGARRSYALAADALASVKDPAYINLRQSLLQERDALDSLGEDPRVVALAMIDRFGASLADAPPAIPAASTADGAPWWRRAFSNVFDIQPRDRATATLPAERNDAVAALQLELTLARAAAERRDVDGYGAALRRASAWLTRLWPRGSDAYDSRQRALDAIAAQPISLAVPTLGTTLQQLRQMRAVRQESP